MPSANKVILHHCFSCFRCSVMSVPQSICHMGHMTSAYDSIGQLQITWNSPTNIDHIWQ